MAMNKTSKVSVVKIAPRQPQRKPEEIKTNVKNIKHGLCDPSVRCIRRAAAPTSIACVANGQTGASGHVLAMAITTSELTKYQIRTVWIRVAFSLEKGGTIRHAKMAIAARA